MSTAAEKRTVLVAIVRSTTDWAIAQQEGWYRIPVRSAPRMVSDGSIRYIAFYHPRVFAEERFSIRYYAEVTGLEVRQRRQFFPNEPLNEKSERNYYLVRFEKLLPLERPIPSLRHRRIIFVPTTLERLHRSTEINGLFSDSPLEDALWDAFRDGRIPVERQFPVHFKGRRYLLDFAIFCRDRNIDIECDGHAYHTSRQQVQSDKDRNNLLTSAGWTILRFTSEDIRHRLGDSVHLVKETVNRYGGIEDASRPGLFRLLGEGMDDL